MNPHRSNNYAHPYVGHRQKLTLVATGILLSCSLSAQDSVSRDFVISDTVVLEEEKRRVFINVVEEPALSSPRIETPAVEETALSEEEIATLLQDRVLPIYFSVSATIYDNSKTFVRFWGIRDGQTQRFSVWSNVNWNHLGGFSSFKVGDQEYTYLLMHGNASYEDLVHRIREGKEALVPEYPSSLSEFNEIGARYVVMEGDEMNERALDFIEGIHDFYTNNSETLEAAYLERVRENEIRRRALKSHQEKERDIIINYWPSDGAKGISK